MNHKHEALWVIEKMYVIYFMHIDFIQSFSSNHWIKLSFEFQNVVMHILKFFFSYVWGFQKMPLGFQLTTCLSYLLYIIFLR